MLSNHPRPIVIVTGANNGVGFGICHRLLSELSSASRELNDLELACDGLTLILACRNKQRAEAARAKLCDIADEQVVRAKRSPNYDGHAEIFRRNLRIVIHTVDLADVHSVFHFADEVGQSYPYVSHLICNAGVVCFEKIVWLLVFKQFLTNFIAAVTTPRFFLQRIGDLSQDGLGWVWQCNVFGHFVLFRALEPMMSMCTGSRVVWVSSHESSSEFYDPKDWQLVKSGHSYECSKYQMNMISLYLDREAARNQLGGTPAVRHFTAYPGVAGTSIASALVGTFMTLCMHATFYLARFLGSTDHTISIVKAAVSAVYLSLTPLTRLPSATGVESSTDLKEPVEVGTIYTSKTNMWGCEFVGTAKLFESREEEAETKELVENCDRLMRTFCDIQGRSSNLA